MAQIRPFAGIRYARRFHDVSALIAPPYDVLDDEGKKRLQAKHPNNIVTVDLPHMPPKSLGPDEVYERASTTLSAWISAGVMARDPRAALYPYTQTYDYAARTFHRRGFLTLVKLAPFDAGEVIPHEKTYQGPIEDRMKLMRSTGVQLSPIFGLFSDPKNEVTNLLYRQVGKPEQTAMLDGVKNDLWSVIDAEIENQVIDLMKRRAIYIADGHHRYTTALQYQKEQIEAAGGKLSPSHPANWCMFVLVGMQDPGLLILPTHRLIGGTGDFDITIFKANVSGVFEVTETNLTPPQFDDPAIASQPKEQHTFGLYDGSTKKLWKLRLKNLDVLKSLEPKQSEAWRHLDVAILQRYLLDGVIEKNFAGRGGITRGYTANPAEVPKAVDGKTFQIALMLRPTPLQALEELGKHHEVMPQKSTYFYPKLATGMVLNSLR